MRIMLVAYLGTERVILQQTDGVVFGVLIQIILIYGLITKGYRLNQMVALC